MKENSNASTVLAPESGKNGAEVTLVFAESKLISRN